MANVLDLCLSGSPVLSGLTVLDNPLAKFCV